MYRAKDTRLGRSAAITVLPPEVALDDDRRLRFEREARALATLNHPHIAQIYGLEDLPAVHDAPASFALVVELVEGEDLAQRISRGPVALDDVWPLARQIAEGLEAAHDSRDTRVGGEQKTPDQTLGWGFAPHGTDIHARAHESVRRLISFCSALTAEELHRPLSGFGFPAVLRRLDHTIGAEVYWQTVATRGYREEATMPPCRISQRWRHSGSRRLSDANASRWRQRGGVEHAATDDQ